MGSRFPDPAIGQNEDSVGAPNGGQTVGDDNRRTPFHQVLQCLLNQRFRFGIQRRGCFIQNQDRRIFQQCPRDRDALALASGEPQAAFADSGAVI